jgi:hypothetical protein
MYLFYYVIYASQLCSDPIDYSRNTVLFETDAEGLVLPYGLRPTGSMWMVPGTVPIDGL